MAILHGLLCIGINTMSGGRFWERYSFNASANASEVMAASPTRIIRPADWLLIGIGCFIHARLGRIWLPRSGPGPMEVAARVAAEAAAAAAVKVKQVSTSPPSSTTVPPPSGPPRRP